MDTVRGGRTFKYSWIALLLLSETSVGHGGHCIRGRVPMAVVWGDRRSGVHAAHIESRLLVSSWMGSRMGGVAHIRVWLAERRHLRSIEELVGLGRVYVTRRTDNRLLGTWLKASVVERIMDGVVVDVEVGWLELALMLRGVRNT
jgi:hypothetical protein